MNSERSEQDARKHELRTFVGAARSPCGVHMAPLLPVFTRSETGQAYPTRVTIASKQGNDKQGFTLAYDSKADRYRVRLDSGEEVYKPASKLTSVVDDTSVEAPCDRPAFRSVPRPVLVASTTCESSACERLNGRTADVFAPIYHGKFLIFKVQGGTEEWCSIGCALFDPQAAALFQPCDLMFCLSARLSNEGNSFTPWLEFPDGHALSATETKLRFVLLLRVMFIAASSHLEPGRGGRWDGVEMPDWMLDSCLQSLAAYLPRRPYLLAELLEVHRLIVERELTRGRGAAHQQYKLGEVLEAAEHYELAAKLYAESGHVMRVCDDHEAPKAHNAAGLAWKRAGYPENAEAEYVLSLSIAVSAKGTATPLSDVEATFDNLITAYHKHMAEHGKRTTRENFVPALATIVSTLLAALGNKNCAFDLPRVRKLLTRQAAKQPKGALLAVAMEASDVRAFRNALLGCINTKVNLL